MSAPGALPTRGVVVGGRYRVDGELGRGAMGVVYSATHTVTGAAVALKWVASGVADELQRARLLREARAAGRVRHPNVVQVYDVGEHEGAVFLVMERLVGRSLGDAMLATGPLAPADAVRLLMPALRAVAAAHAAGVIHRDLKPDNLFVAEDSNGQATVKVLDFGISKLHSQTSPELHLTQTGVVIGTPLYMSPEQLKGKTLDGRCDQYALACILYELVEGEAPFVAETFAELSVAKLTGAMRPFATPDVPVELQQALRRALSKDPARRFPDVSAFAAALEPVAEGVHFDDGDTSGLFSAGEVRRLVEAQEQVTTHVDDDRLALARRRLGLRLGAALLLVLGGVALAVALRPDAPAQNAVGVAALAEPEEPVEHEPVQSSPLAPEPGAEGPTEDTLEEPGDEVDSAPTTMRRRPGQPTRGGGHRTGGVRLGDF